MTNVEHAIQRVQQGSLEDYRFVVLAFHSSVRALVAGLCPPGVDSDEVAHCAFIEAYRRIEQYRLNTDFFAWLSAIARNLLRAECEKIRRRSRNEQNYLDYLLVEQFDRALDQEPVLLAARARFLAECVSQLDRRARSLLAMRYHGGVRVQEIARRLARSVSGVSVQLFTLRKRLRECVRRKLAQGEAGAESTVDYGPA